MFKAIIPGIMAAASLLLLSSASGASEPRLKDPMRPQIMTESVTDTVTPAPVISTPWPQLTLQSVSVIGNLKSARINNQTVREQDEIQNVRIHRINPGSIELQYQGETRSLWLSGKKSRISDSEASR